MLVNFACEKQVLIARKVVVYSLNMVQKVFFPSASLDQHHSLVSLRVFWTWIMAPHAPRSQPL